MSEGLFTAKKLDGFTHESPIRAFTEFQVDGAYAVGKGFRPSMQHLTRYLDAMERKEKWRVVQIILSPTGGEPTILFRRDIYDAVMPELSCRRTLDDRFSHAQGESEGNVAVPDVTVFLGAIRDISPDDSVLHNFFPPEGEREPIPDLVYYDAENQNFYGLVSQRGQGHEFYAKWHRRRDEFPQSPAGFGIDCGRGQEP